MFAGGFFKLAEGFFHNCRVGFVLGLFGFVFIGENGRKFI